MTHSTGSEDGVEVEAAARARTEPLRVLDLFSGIGGFSLGLERTGGFKTIAFCEIDPFCRQVLAKHWPGVPIYEDVTKAQYTYGDADIITGGFPCQDISLAGKRTGIAGERSGLYREMVRAIRVVQPTYSLMENVAALLGNGMGQVLGDMAEIGYDAEWDCISASDVGAPHGRDRVWIAFAHAHKLQRETRFYSPTGWWLWSKSKAKAASCWERKWKLPGLRFLDAHRRWIGLSSGGDPWHGREWAAEFAALRGMDDGLPDGLDRSDNAAGVRGLGNAVVPQIPEMIGNAILSAYAAQARAAANPSTGKIVDA